jgi:hypothetical protein
MKMFVRLFIRLVEALGHKRKKERTLLKQVDAESGFSDKPVENVEISSEKLFPTLSLRRPRSFRLLCRDKPKKR